jgi:hypothetical protein
MTDAQLEQLKLHPCTTSCCNIKIGSSIYELPALILQDCMLIICAIQRFADDTYWGDIQCNRVLYAK